MINNNLTEEKEDAYWLKVAEEAMEEHRTNPTTYTTEQVMQELNITQEELDAITDEDMEAFCRGTEE